MPENALQSLFERLATPATLTELVVLALIVLLGLAGGHFGRLAFQRSHWASAENWQSRVMAGAVACLAPFLILVLLLIARGSAQLFSVKPDLLDAGLKLVAALLLVRLAMYLLCLALGKNSWVARREIWITAFIWIAAGFSLLGWFDLIELRLDSIDLLPGKAKFTIWGMVKGILIISLFLLLAVLASRTIESRVMKMQGLALSTRIGISKFFYFFLLGLGILLGINAAGVDLTALTVLTGAVGLGLGFGLQAIASNFVSGFVLLMDRSIKPGDVISFTGVTGTSTENFGWVQELRGRYVVVRDRDGVSTLVPNQNLITNPVINWSYSDPKVRLRLPVRISYQDDPEVALEVLVQAAHCNPRVLADPPPVSRLIQFSDSGIDLELRFWITDPQEGVHNVRSDVNRAIWRLFKQHGITIPVTQHDVRMVTVRSDDE